MRDKRPFRCRCGMSVFFQLKRWLHLEGGFVVVRRAVAARTEAADTVLAFAVVAVLDLVEVRLAESLLDQIDNLHRVDVEVDASTKAVEGVQRDFDAALRATTDNYASRELPVLRVKHWRLVILLRIFKIGTREGEQGVGLGPYLPSCPSSRRVVILAGVHVSGQLVELCADLRFRLFVETYVDGVADLLVTLLRGVHIRLAEASEILPAFPVNCRGQDLGSSLSSALSNHPARLFAQDKFEKTATVRCAAMLPCTSGHLLFHLPRLFSSW